MKQVDKSHYTFGRYTKIDRWSSYFYQIREVFRLKPSSVLEIGVGEGVLRDYLKTHGIEYTSFDMDGDLNPDIVGDVKELPFQNMTYDVVCAFEVLEHLPFESFGKALGEMLRVSKKYVILSLPHFGPPIILDLKIPFLRRFQFAFKIPFFKKHIFDGEHYWEIGKSGYSFSKIRNEITKYAYIEREYVPFENQYHHFFIIQKK